MKIATFNVNGVNARLPVLLRWLAEVQPDVACLQELKAPQEKFPLEALRQVGYHAVWHGQKSWNGVAILARGRDPLEASRGLITALYMKEITDPQWKNDKGYQDWVAFMKKYYPEGALDDQGNAFGYTAAQAMTLVLKQCGNDLSRENILRQAENLKNVEFPLLLPGIKVNTSPTDHAPIEQEQLAKFDGERWATFGELYDAAKK